MPPVLKRTTFPRPTRKETGRFCAIRFHVLPVQYFVSLPFQAPRTGEALAATTGSAGIAIASARQASGPGFLILIFSTFRSTRGQRSRTALVKRLRRRLTRGLRGDRLPRSCLAQGLTDRVLEVERLPGGMRLVEPIGTERRGQRLRRPRLDLELERLELDGRGPGGGVSRAEQHRCLPLCAGGRERRRAPDQA